MPDLFRILQVAFGIGLVIFVHELGHFLAARWCGVRVLTFSLGFGPRLLSWTRGHTTYQIAAVPLGGYVQMAGEFPGEAGGPVPSDHLPAKSVGQRFLIYSGGVLMNLAFGLVVFPLVFLSGVRFTEPRLGSPVPGSSAWAADIPAGSTVLEVNGERVFEYSQVDLATALGGSRPVELLWRPPSGTEPVRTELAPERNTAAGFYLLGVTAALDPTGKLFISPGSAAEQAGLVTGDRLLELVSIGDRPPLDRPLDRQLRTALISAAPLTLRVAAPSGAERLVVIPPEMQQAGTRRILGVAAPQNAIAALRSAELIGPLGLRVGDRVQSVDGRSIGTADDWAEALERGPFPPGLDVRIEREGSPLDLHLEQASAAQRRELSLATALETDDQTTRVVPSPGEAAAQAGLLAGDRVLSIDGVELAVWQDLQQAVQAGVQSGKPLELVVERPGSSAPLRFEVEPKTQAPLPLYGFSVAEAQYTFHADGVLDALGVGMQASWKAVRDIWLTLKGMLLSNVSSKNLGSIIMIGQVSYSFSEAGLSKLFYFLCLLSMNLAFINVLPVPMLDGGHLLFLALEKLRGRPLPERVIGYGQMIGLVLLVGLMVYATYNDVLRLIQ